MIHLLVIFLSVTADAWSEVGISRSWWEWRVTRLVSFYLPLIYILYVNGYFVKEKLIELAMMVAIGLLWWSFVYKSIGKF